MPNDKEFRPRCTQDEYDNLQKYRAIKDHANEMGMDNRDVDSGWLKSKEASLHFKNPNFQAPDFSVDKIDWDKITKGVFDRAAVEKDGCDKIEWVETRRGGVIGAGATIMPYGVSPNKGIFDRLVYTDVHIGMDIPDTAQYGGTWNYDEVMKCLSQMIAFTLDNQKSDILIVDDLGDFMDGMGGKTVRRMHSLPQNMTDQEAFDIGLEFKIRLANELYPQYETIHFHNICNDNHAGAFGYTVNSAFKSVAKTMFKNVTVDNYQKFINHYEILNNTFIISHGKDGKNLKFGFKPHISVGGLGKINNYIDTEYLMKKGVRIEFSKGDSHVELRDKATPNRFEYCNYPAFCPASDWVQTNYVPNDYGFYLFNYSDTNRYRVNPFYFNG
jgi:hypothetical protein